MAEPQPLIGITISHYRIIEKLGAGAGGLLLPALTPAMNRIPPEG